MSEPLKNKTCLCNLRKYTDETMELHRHVHLKKLKSAVKWLKARWPEAEALHKDIDEAFEDAVKK